MIINEGLYDRDYVARHTVGFDQLRDRVYEYPPELVSRWTGIPAQDIVRLAQEYAMTRPAAIRVNYGVQRSENGGSAMRAICMLPCVTGSWKDLGGGLQLSLSGSFPLNKKDLERTDLMNLTLGRPARTVNMVELGKALATLNDPPIKALFVYGSNPAAVAPNHNLVVQQLRRDDLFTVTHEQFLTDTTDYADLVLPATTFFEHKDLQPSYGHYYLQVSQAAIAPVGECRSNVEVFRALAEHMGFEDECFRESVDEMIDVALETDHQFLEGITRERLEHEDHVRLNLGGTNGKPEVPFLPFANGNFKTSSGKAELYSEVLAAQGFDPIAKFVPPVEVSKCSRCRSWASSTRIAGTKSGQLLEFQFLQSTGRADDGVPGTTGDPSARCACPQYRRWADSARVQRPGSDPARGANHRCDSTEGCGGATGLGQTFRAGRQHQRTYL